MIPGNLVTITGQTLFVLHDTYGLHPEIVAYFAKDYGFYLDTVGYKEEMQLAKKRSRNNSKMQKEIFTCS